MASISWTDDSGPATLENAHAGTPASRFAMWQPRSRSIGEKKEALADGQRHSFRFRADHGATFELRDIPESHMELMLRLSEHLDDGGTITVNTGDGASRSYTCCLAPGSEPPDPQLSDETLLWYTMAFNVITPSGGPMLCIYG